MLNLAKFFLRAPLTPRLPVWKQGLFFFSTQNDAISLLQRKLESVKSLHGTNHKEYLETLFDLGTCYYEQGEFVKGIEQFYQSLEITESLKLTNYHNLAVLCNNIGHGYFMQNNLEQAFKYLQKAIAYSMKIEESNSPILIESLFNFAQLNETLDVPENALEIYESILEMQQEKFGAESPELEPTLFCIGRIHARSRNLTEAKKFLEKSLNFRRKLNENEPEKIAEVLSELGQVCLLQNSREEALNYYGESLEILEKTGDKEKEIPDILSNISILYKMAGDLETAQKYLDQSFSKRGKTKDKGLFVQLANNAEIFGDQEKYKEAAAEMEKAIEAFESLFGQKNLEYAQLARRAAVFHTSAEQYEEAFLWYEQVMQVLGNILSKGSKEAVNELVSTALERAATSDMLGRTKQALESLKETLHVVSGKKDLEVDAKLIEKIQKEIEKLTKKIEEEKAENE